MPERRMVDSAGHVRLPVEGFLCPGCRYWTPARDVDPELPRCFVCATPAVRPERRWEREA